VPLMERDGRGLRPTAAGEAYAAYATDVLGLLDQGARAACEAHEHAQRTLRVGAVTTAGEHLVAPLLRVFREGHPELEITLHVGNRADVFERLVAHDIDVAITGRLPEHLPVQGERFAANDFLLITSPTDPLANRAKVSVAELSDRTWLLREPGSGTRTLSEEYLAGHDLTPRTVTLGSNGAIKQAVALGLGIALQSRFAVQLELEVGMLGLIRPREGLPRRGWHVVYSTVGPTRREVSAFVEFTQSRAAQQALSRALRSSG
jgi:LysR family transcriptional regulator, low CO2-responsive transcriptional regulator